MKIRMALVVDGIDVNGGQCGSRCRFRVVYGRCQLFMKTLSDMNGKNYRCDECIEAEKQFEILERVPNDTLSRIQAQDV